MSVFYLLFLSSLILIPFPFKVDFSIYLFIFARSYLTFSLFCWLRLSCFATFSPFPKRKLPVC